MHTPYTIFPLDYKCWTLFDERIRFTPNESEIKEVIGLLEKYFYKHNGIKEWKEYKTQYFGYIDNNNQKIIWANCFCNSYNAANWKTELVFVCDWGSCFFDIKINLEKKEIFDLFINSES